MAATAVFIPPGLVQLYGRLAATFLTASAQPVGPATAGSLAYAAQRANSTLDISGAGVLMVMGVLLV